MKKSIVTGGCGFIGRNLTRKLLSLGHNVLVIDDLSTGIRPELWLESSALSRITFLPLPCESVDAEEPIKSFISSASEVFFFHFAGIVRGRKFIEEKPFNISRNVHIDNSIIRLASELKPSHFIYPSSSAVYPTLYQQRGSFQALKEEMVSTNGFSAPDQTYGWSKLIGEVHATILYEKFGVPTTIVRPFSGYGPDQSSHYPIPSLVRRFVNQEDPMTVWGSGEQLRDFVYVDDLIEAILLCISTFPAAQPINIGSGVATSFAEILNLLSSLTSFDPIIKNDGSKPEGVFGRYCDPSKLQRATNWKPKVTLEAGLQNVIDAIGS